jgi:hypothetical protein
MTDTDLGTVQNEGPYIVELFGDEDGVGGNEAARVRVTQDGHRKSSVRVVRGATARFMHTARQTGSTARTAERQAGRMLTERMETPGPCRSGSLRKSETRRRTRQVLRQAAEQGE